MRTLFWITLFSLILSACRKEKASWDTDWRVPLISDTLRLNKLVTDSILDINADGSYHLVINRNILEFGLDSIVKLPDTMIQQSTTISVPSVSVPPGVSFINQEEVHAFDVEDFQLKKVVLKSGKAEIKVKSKVPGATYLTLQLPSVKKNGTSYSKTLYAPAANGGNPTVLTDVVDLQDYEIDLTGASGASFNQLRSKLIVQSDPNGETFVFSNQDSIIFEVRFKNLIPNYARGYFGNQLITDTTTVDIDLMDNITAGVIDLDNVKLKIELLNGLKTSARSKFTLVENGGISNTTIALNHPQIGPWIWLNQATGPWDNLVFSSHVLEFNQLNSNIEAFLENIPRFLRLGYGIELNPWGNVSGSWDELFPTSKVIARLTADMPLAIGMNQLTYADTFDIELANDGSAFTVKEGEFEIQTSNAYSFQGQLQLVFLGDQGQVLMTKNASESIAGAASTTNFNPIQIVKSKVFVRLNEEETEKALKMKKLVVKAIFDSPQNGQIATLYDGQFLAFKLFTNLKIRTTL
jgi:hypothetical protein